MSWLRRLFIIISYLSVAMALCLVLLSVLLSFMDGVAILFAYFALPFMILPWMTGKTGYVRVAMVFFLLAHLIFLWHALIDY